MTTRSRSAAIIFITLLVGAMVGTLLGDLLGMVLPPGVVKELFLRSVSFALGPAEIDLLVMNLTIGFAMKLNFSGVIGLGAAYYLLRYFR